MNIRPFTEADYAPAADLWTLAHPDAPATEAELRLFDAEKGADEVYEAFVVEQGGQVLGFGYAQTPPRFNPVAGEGRIDLRVHPEHPALFAELFGFLERQLLGRKPRAVSVGSSEAWPELGFYRSRGYAEFERLWDSRLDLERFDPAPHRGYLEQALQSGVVIQSLAEMPGDEAFQRRLYGLTIELLEDIPREGPFAPWPFETWLKRAWNAPDLLPPGYFIAVHDGEMVGLSQLWKSGRPQTLQTGLTGVRSAWRRRGIAQALKLWAAEYARREGFRYLRTTNHQANRPMLALNERMGFEKEPAWVSLKKEIEP